jgi:hypothetical protein
MKTYLHDSATEHDNAKGSAYSVSRVNVLRGYIHPSDYSVAITFGLVGLGVQ